MSHQKLMASYCALTLTTFWLQAAPLGTAFTYQGRLQDGANMAQGLHDMQFTLHDEASGGNLVAGPLIHGSVVVSSGLFTITLDFGQGVFTGGAHWLEVSVRSHGSETFTTLAPRQAIAPAPYALFAPRAGEAASALTAANALAVPWAGLSGMPAGFADGVDHDTTYVAGPGLVLSGAAFSLDTEFTDGRYWRLGGNAGTTPASHFLGTTDLQPLELRVNGQRALRLESAINQYGEESINVLAGSPHNSLAPGITGAVIAGGGVGYLQGFAPQGNRVEADYGSILGGVGNRIGSGHWGSAITGGWSNTILNAAAAVIGGGRFNLIGNTGHEAVIGGGYSNRTDQEAYYATIGGGIFNAIGYHADRSVIAGGANNRVQSASSYAAIGGGRSNVVNGYVNTIAGGDANSIYYSIYSAIGGGQGNFAGSGSGYTAIAGGMSNRVEGLASVVAGGAVNLASALAASVAGGESNQATNSFAAVGGGRYNTAGGSHSTVSGGGSNVATNDYATVVGGQRNLAGGSHSLAAGYRAQALHPGSFVWADNTDADFASTGDNQFLIRAAGGVGIGTGAPETALHVVGTVRAGAFVGDGSGLEGVASLAANPAFTGRPAFLGGSSGASAPFSVDSDFKVANLNADLLDGVDSSAFARLDGSPTFGGHVTAIGRLSGATLYIGKDHTLTGVSAGIGGGLLNTNKGANSFIGGGQQNAVDLYAANGAIGSGYLNAIRDDASFSFIGSGAFNVLSNLAECSVIGGGFSNRISLGAKYAAIPGGLGNVAAQDYTFAAGRRAKANHPGAFVWADSTDADFASTGNNQFLIRAGGGVGIGGAPQDALLDIEGPARLNNADLFLRHGADRNHGLGWYGLNYVSKSFAGVDVDGPVLYGYAGGALASKAGGEKVALHWTSGGHVGIGTAGPLDVLHVAGTDGAFLRLDGGLNNNTGLRLGETNGLRWTMFMKGWQDEDLEFFDEVRQAMTLVLQSGTRRVGIGRDPTANELEVSGAASKSAAGSWLANSDVRIKQDIQTVTDAIETLDRVRLVSFRYTDDYRAQHEELKDRRYLNVVAQEFRDVFPEAVESSGERLGDDGEELLQVDTHPLTIYTAAAVQELNRKLKRVIEEKDVQIQELTLAVADLTEMVRQLAHRERAQR
jgi:hypothetical protein